MSPLYWANKVKQQYFADNMITMTAMGLFCGAMVILLDGCRIEITLPLLLVFFTAILLVNLLNDFSFFNKTIAKPQQIIKNMAAIFAYMLMAQSFMMIITYVSPASPMPLADIAIKNLDSLLGGNVEAFSNYFYQHHRMAMNIFLSIYQSLKIAIIIYPVIGHKNPDRAIRGIYILLTLSIFFTLPIIYFLPTVCPSFVFKNIEFINIHKHLESNIQPYLAFRQNHRTDMLGVSGNDVSLPSYHVLLALTFSYGLWPKNRIGQLLLVLYTSLITLSTLILGLHYFSDVICSYLLFGSILLAMRYGLLGKGRFLFITPRPAS